MKILIVSAIGNKQHEGQSISNQEIVEFGAMVFDTELNQGIVGTRCIIIPQLTSSIYEYCTTETGLTQRDVDESGKTYFEFVDFIDHFCAFYDIEKWAYWGKDAKKLLDTGNGDSDISPDFFYKKSISIKKIFRKHYKCGKMNLRDALEHVGLERINMSSPYLRASAISILCRHISFDGVKL